MADVARTTEEVQRVIYAVGPDTARHAILDWLCDQHDASFPDNVRVEFLPDGGARVVSEFAAITKATPEDRSPIPPSARR